MGISLGRQLSPHERSNEKYCVLAELGEGGMGNVYLTVLRGPASFNKLLVLKAIKEELALDPELLAMFLDEARLAARLSHPNVVQTLEVSELQGRPVIVMEYLDGKPLSSILYRAETRAMSLAMKLRIVAAALEGLNYIHELKGFDGTPLQLVHRDVSPHNIFVTYDGQVKVLDFGIAKGIISQGTTRTDVLKGKIRYMAPEQMGGTPVDHRADIFSAGVILWEIATGRRLWHALSEVNVMHAVLHEGAPAPRSVEPAVSPELDEICVKALARSPGDRYQTAAELLAALEGLLERMGSRVTPKDAGKLLAEAFAEDRARTNALIDAELKKTHLETSGGERFELADTLLSLGLRTEGPGARDGSATRSGERPLERAASRRRWIPLTVALAVGALLGGFLTFRRPTVESRPAALAMPGSTPTAPAPSDFASSAPVERRAVAVELSDANEARPADGAAAPSKIALDRAKGPVVPSRPVNPNVAGRPEPPVPPSSPSASSTVFAAPGQAAPSESAPPAKDKDNSHCEPPFYFDAQGIKRLKPECL
jgi:serine/threonine protein kinase